MREWRKQTRAMQWVGALLAAAGTVSAAGPPAPELAVLDQFVGTWAVTVKVRAPQALVVTYTENYRWDLDGHFLHGDSGVKSDGTRDIVIATYDAPGQGYPFWIFSSTGAWYYLAPGSWDARRRTLSWENPPSLPISYRSHCTFPDRNTRHCQTVVKDWKGSVLLDQDATAVRRR
ncbi:DUF1579 family protein [Denitromonas iodatirespirans]|uniref:DUF1579 family protein n=1 Tax=Denitromonas iodatirespirans TaxID=2795389 RepID=A0A944H9M4_DENI1|nr:DUF1579 family protein [Denitromonas iodatirespirans]MBT0963578.1 DUF1579 family protein [Denitromonas iodatirespirans]